MHVPDVACRFGAQEGYEMKLLRILLVSILLILGTACTPLMRGVESGKLVSGGQPPLTVSCVLPLNTAGSANPFIMTDVGFQTPATWLAVYGAESPTSPLAIAVFSEAPERMHWDFASFSLVDGPVNGEVLFGGRAFASALRIIDAANDPFTPLLGLQTEKASELRWLAQRYTVLTHFRQGKVILEYREPLPAWADTPLRIQLLSDPRLQAFSRRAQQVFDVQFAYAGPPIAGIAPIQGLDQRPLGRFLGSLSPINPLIEKRD